AEYGIRDLIVTGVQTCSLPIWFLFVRAPRRELYDEVADAPANRNVAETRGRVADAMDREMEQFIRRAGGAAGSPESATVDPSSRSEERRVGREVRRRRVRELYK